MKKILFTLILFLNFYSSLNALTSVERFTTVKDQYGEGNVVQFKELNNWSHWFKSFVKNFFIYIKGSQLNEQRSALKTFFKKNPQSILIIDFEKGDGFVDETGRITLRKEHLPQNVKKLVISNIAGDINAIGDSFLDGYEGLTNIDLSPLSQVRTIGDGFLAYCKGLKSIDLSPLSQVRTIGDGFLSGCAGLTNIDLSPLSQVRTIGNSFLSCCKGLTNIDLSPLSQIRIIESNFLAECEGLTNIDLSPLSQVRTIEHYFLSGCYALANINGLDDTFMERLDDESRKNLMQPLRESNFPALQQLGADLYMRYLYVPEPRVKDVLAPWDLDVLKAMTPKPLADVPNITKDDVLAAFNIAMTYCRDLNTETRSYYETHLRPILCFVFGNKETHVTWQMYDAQLAEMRITLKHIAKKLNVRITNNQDIDAYMAIMLDGFAHCQSRQASELNKAATFMGLMPMTNETGHMKPIYEMVNAYKLQQFEAYVVKNKAAGAHNYARRFTAINSTIGLPVAMQSFEERINPLTDGEANNMLAKFFINFFTPDLLANYVFMEIQKTQDKPLNKKGSTLSGIIHDFMAENGDEYWLEQLDEGFDDDDEGINRFNVPVTEDEIIRLLQYMGILKKEDSQTTEVLMEE